MATTGRSLGIDIIIPNVGRIKKRTGTNDPKVHDAIKVMIEQLRQKADYDRLRAIKDGKVPILVMYEAWREQALDKLDLSDGSKPLSAFYDWLDTYTKANPRSKANYRSAFRQLAKLATKSSTLKHLPAMLGRYKALCLRNDTPRGFGHAKNACRSFIKDTLGKRHPLYVAIEQIEGLDESAKRKDTALSVRLVEELTGKLPTEAAEMVWTMATTGIESNVYFPLKWDVVGDSVHIRGEKQKKKDDRRNRFVPVVYPSIRPSIGLKSFRRLLKEANPDVQIRDLRRSYARWMYEAGLSPLHIKSYMGHGLSMSEHYGKSDLSAHMKSDGDLLREYIDEHRKVKPPKRQRLGKGMETAGMLVEALLDAGIKDVTIREGKFIKDENGHLIEVDETNEGGETYLSL